ncbi:NAD(P)/FAD-dependent oxidoreductase [Streptomyces ossamyceticus]|uniref:NAD(P)/FAD-dependent oxidoreductase n=1 Tax=Streptomyces ossamyceticus TaxID=249581 RepID=UPI0006E13675|nr:FAD-dependent oxidoreductase [Streptomyces ossamyceticus]
MKHRIVVLGAGYAGAYVAGTLARRLDVAEVGITVVNAEPDFVQRLRLHQLAAGQEISAPPLADVFAGTGVRLRLARVTAVDPERRVVAIAESDGASGRGRGDGGSGGDGAITYDTLVYALGSRGATHGVPGVTQHAFDVAARSSALRLRACLDGLDARGDGGSVVVVGDGLTGIETATEIAESRPGLSVTLVARRELGAPLSAGARGHLRRACDRLGVTVLEHTGAAAVEAGRVLCVDGSVLASDATVWTAGFAVAPIAATAGLDVAADGRIVVDRTMRSVSHPDVYAVGDSAHAIGDSGLPLPMSCASAGYTGRQATAAIVARLTGGKVTHTGLEYVGNHISLGRLDGVLQMVDHDAKAKPRFLGGRKAARIKAGILRMSLWTTSHPTFGLPTRRHRLATAPPAPTTKAAVRPVENANGEATRG